MNTAQENKLENAGANQPETEIDVSKFGGESGQADVFLVVEDVRIPVIKVVLSLVSPVFRAMFEGDFKEKNLKEIPLPGKKLGPFVCFLSWIYRDKTETLTASNAIEVAELASEYQVMKLTEECDEFLWRFLKKQITSLKQPNGCGLHSQNTCNVFQYLQLAESLGLVKFTNMCVQIASEVDLQTRKDAFQKCTISVEIKRKITDLAVERLDLFERDTRYLMSILGRNSPKDAIRGEFQFRLSPTPKERLRTVRLAYVFFGHSSDVYAECLKEIKGDLNANAKYLSDESFLIMPERVKADIKWILSNPLNGRL